MQNALNKLYMPLLRYSKGFRSNFKTSRKVDLLKVILTGSVANRSAEHLLHPAKFCSFRGIEEVFNVIVNSSAILLQRLLFAPPMHR